MATTNAGLPVGCTYPMSKPKDPNAQALGRKRAKSLTAAHQSAAAKALAESMTPEQRAERARKAGLANAGKKRKKGAGRPKKGSG